MSGEGSNEVTGEGSNEVTSEVSNEVTGEGSNEVTSEVSNEPTGEVSNDQIQEQDVIDFCKKKGWMIVRYKYCSCDVFIDPELIPGYDGDSKLGCGHCADLCPRCKQPSCCIQYSSTGISDKYGEVCYGCAVGDYGSEYSSNESSSESDDNLS